MYYAYVIYSPSFKRFYKGHCADLQMRLEGHNSGNTHSTKPFRPWKIIYFESFDTMEEAIGKEKYFKTAAGRRYLKSHIDKSNGSCL